jgi:ribose transport system permease protein
VLWWATPAFLFLSADSLRPLLIEVAPIALIGVGMTLVIVSAGIDVSGGSAIMVCGVITARLLVQALVSLVVAALVAIVVGALLGVVNSVLIAWERVHAIIITFGTLNLFQFEHRFSTTAAGGQRATRDQYRRVHRDSDVLRNAASSDSRLRSLVSGTIRHTIGKITTPTAA